MDRALPTVQMRINGKERRVLVDTGCTKCIAHESCRKRWRRKPVGMTALNGRALLGQGIGTVWLQPTKNLTAKVDVVPSKTAGIRLHCRNERMNGVKALGGVLVDSRGRARFGPSEGTAGAAKEVDITLEEPDFIVTFDHAKQSWTIAWKWRNGKGPDVLKNVVREYPPMTEARGLYEEELRTWIEQGWLVPYAESKYGPAKGLIPLMAVVQRSKKKVRPVMDFRELNAHIETFTAHADVCADKLRQWRRQGVNLAMVDLNKDYLQIHVDETLWPYQTVVFMGRRYCLTRMGFGLNVAPLVMTTLLNHVLSLDPDVRKGTSAYIDDILVNEDIVSAHRVQRHLARYGLTCKAPERVTDGTRILGLRVWGERGRLEWARGGEIPSMPSKPTRRTIFSYCGELVGHYPVCGWQLLWPKERPTRIRPAGTTWSAVVSSWGCCARLMLGSGLMIPFAGVETLPGRIWVDASGIAIGVAVEIGGSIVEDATWLHPNDACHINKAELDAVIRGLNLALAWGLKAVELMTDSATVHRWVFDGISGKAGLKTKAAGEMLIRRRIDTILSLVQEYDLHLKVTLVKSAESRADALTRVPRDWLKLREAAAPAECALDVDSDVERRTAEVHHTAGHPGIRRTLYFVRRSEPTVTRRQVKSVVANCEACQSIDPSPIRWKPGSLSVEVWQRLAMDVTHCGGQAYLTLIDSGPSRFTVWCPLKHHSSAAVVDQLEAVFYERGAPEEILADNDTAFRSRLFTQLAAKWDVHLRYQCAHVPSGNGIVERCHRTVKVIAARKRCPVAEAVHLYNITPRNGCDPETAPVNMLYAYRIRLRGVNRPVREKPHEHCSCDIGDCVWVKPPATRCNSRYQRGVVIGIVSEHAVEVDGIPRHIRDLRRRAPSENSAGECTTEGPESGPIMALPARLPTVIKTMWTAATADTRTNGIQQRDDGAKTMATLTSEEADVRRPSRTGIGRQCILCD
ncbi:LOW QUALITY PROTEIN: hypothetical protein M514_26898 [Trichuris suis]|uniref:Integrase catalytic domain-containing protein n=1 Tax=Trichuris suis TaxID=68888 RepID=A0A085MUL3_9BILA|nr:LOW QUALITY PROTEIN: hypothetical protein M514_26898 [Trichuris suis]